MSDPVADLKRELLVAAEREHNRAPVPVQRRGFGDRARAPRLLLGGAALAVAAAAALFFTTPWSNSPSFLERAQAALTLPQGMILHMKWGEPPEPGCTVRSTAELWLDAYSERVGGQRYRAVVHDPFDPFKDRYHQPPLATPCFAASTYEIGGFTNGDVFRFVPPNKLVDTRLRGGPPPNLALPDNLAALRRALRTGNARDEGRTKRDGRTVEHIRLKWGDAYVDPDTFYPVEISGAGDDFGGEFHFKVYEYLPRTAANLALTNIGAQHPHASGDIRPCVWSCETP
jgi:hypothetical protein